MVIECPNCVTKFAVDAQQLAEVERPRFHCSRCDHFFELDDIHAADSSESEESPQASAQGEGVEHAMEDSDPGEVVSSAGRELEKDDSPSDDNELVASGADLLLNEGDPDLSGFEDDFDEYGEEDDDGWDEEENVAHSTEVPGGAPAFGKQPEDTDDDRDEAIETLVSKASGYSESTEPGSFETGSFETGSFESGQDPNPPQTTEPADNAYAESGSGRPRDEEQSWMIDSEKDSATQLALYQESEMEQSADAMPGGSRFRTNRDIENAPPLLAQWPQGDPTAAYEADTAALLHSTSESDGAAAKSTASPDEEMTATLAFDADTMTDAASAMAAASEESSPAGSSGEFAGNTSADDAVKVEDTVNERITDWVTPGEVSVKEGEVSAKEGEVSVDGRAKPASEFRSNWPEEKSVEPERKTDRTPKDEPARQDASLSRLPEAFDEQQEKRNRKLQRAAEIRRERLERERLEALEEVGLASGAAFRPDPKRSKNMRSFVTPLLLMWSVPAFLVWGFSSWSAHTDDSPKVISDLLHLESDDLPLAPPPGLALVDLNSTRKTLHDGSRVLEIEGKVFNATEQPFEDIKLEAKLFDLENRELNSQIVLFNNGLRRAKLPALSKSAILNLQRKRNAGTYDLAPGQAEPFRVVFTEVAGQEHWFSTRVYSVRRSRSRT